MASVADILRERARRLNKIRSGEIPIGALRAYYSKNIPDFISDWMCVVDPRRVARGQIALVPFDLWIKQRELIDFILERIATGTPGVVVKSRDTGVSTVCLATLAALCMFNRGFSAGVISATEAKLDRFKDTLFMKLRELLNWLPKEFRDYESAYLRVGFPSTGSSITGATGANAFRGLRQSVVIVDEAAFLQDSGAIDAALAAVSEVRIDVSTPHGMGGSFFERAHTPAIKRFDISFRDDPRKDSAWYEHQLATLSPEVVAQEILADFAASREGVVIQAKWVQAAIGLAEKLGIKPTGARSAALDLGDTGDRSALAVRHGVCVLHAESWSGAGSNLLKTAGRAFRLCDEWKLSELIYDADGLGASMRGDSEVLNEHRPANAGAIKVVEYRGSSSPIFAERTVPRTRRKWEDLVANRKAQAYYALRQRFEQSHRAANGEPYDIDDIICIDPNIPELNRITTELCQPTMSENNAGKILIDKLGDGERSPNLSDAICMVMAPRKYAMSIHPSVLEQHA
jgi:hypothetical protein